MVPDYLGDLPLYCGGVEVTDAEQKRPVVRMLKRLSVLIESELMPLKRGDSLLTTAYLEQRKVTDMLEGFLRETE